MLDGAGKCNRGVAALFVSLCASVSAGSSAMAQETSVGPARLELLLQALRPNCQRATEQILATKAFSLALSVRPVDTESVCRCTESRFESDPRLAPFWALTAMDMKELMQSRQVESYMTARFGTSMLECLGEAFNASLRSAELPPVPAPKPGDKVDALDEWRLAAQKGDVGSEDALGVMYRDGRGVRRDDAEAVKWFRRAAEQGYANAQDNLGGMYAEGRGVAKDDEAALAWYRKAADQGHPEAQNSLGRIYAEGRGVPPDLPTARLWWQRAAAQGHIGAKSNLEKSPGQAQPTPDKSQRLATSGAGLLRADHLIVPGERIGPLRLAGKIGDIEKLLGRGTDRGPSRWPGQGAVLRTWDEAGVWAISDQATGNIVWISVEETASARWEGYETDGGIRLGITQSQVTLVLGEPERTVDDGGERSLYYDQRGIRVTLIEKGVRSGKVGAIRIVWPSMAHGDLLIVPGQRISVVSIGEPVAQALTALGGGYLGGSNAQGDHSYYWPHLGLSLVEHGGRIATVRSATNFPTDAAALDYRTSDGVGRGHAAAEITRAFGDPEQTRPESRFAKVTHWWVYPSRGIAFALDDEQRVRIIDVFGPGRPGTNGGPGQMV
jgi:hypothetical protein